MAKASKKKTPKYEEKLSFDGTFEQLLGLTTTVFTKKSLKFKKGDEVIIKDNKTAIYTIDSSGSKALPVPNGYDYVAHKKDTEEQIFLKESEIILNK